MKTRSFDRLVVLIAAGLVLVLAAIIGVGSLLGARPPSAVLPESGAVGVRGPFILEFPQNMQRSTVEARFETRPALTGRFVWSGRRVSFWPDQPLSPGEAYTVVLREGALTEDRRPVRKEMSASFTVRAPEVIFLSPVTGDPEVWVSSVEPAVLRPITSTGGSVYDYGVAPDGEHVLYSARNDQNGMNLWMVDRLGSSARLLLDCGPDWCTSPALSTDGVRLAYARRSANVTPGGPPGVPRIWMMAMDSGQTAPLYSDPDITGFDPVWSRQGDQLAFFDSANSGVRVVAMDKEDEVLLPSNMGAVGTWSPDGQRMMFIDMELALDRPYIIVYEADFANDRITPAISSDLSRTEYGRPAWSPDGEWIAIGIRPLGGASTQQIWIMRTDGTGAIEVTKNPTSVYTAYHWDPSGSALVFQRLNLGASSNTPQVMVWQRDTGEFILLAEDSGFADWLP